MFSESQTERYSRHIIMQEVGPEGQLKLLSSKVLIIGVGGLGSPAALYLAAAGIGTIGLADADTVDITNLQRQVIHFTPDIGTLKTKSAANKIKEINPDVEVKIHSHFIDDSNITEIISDYDFIIDGTDNFASKFLINDACVINHKPFSHGGILGFEGQTFTFLPGEGCYRCLFEKPPEKGTVPSCSEAGVLGSIAGILGTIQATEAIKYCIGKGKLLDNRILIFDALTMKFREVEFIRNDCCPVCGDQPTIKTLFMDEGDGCSV